MHTYIYTTILIPIIDSIYTSTRRHKTSDPIKLVHITNSIRYSLCSVYRCCSMSHVGLPPVWPPYRVRLCVFVSVCARLPTCIPVRGGA